MWHGPGPVLHDSASPAGTESESVAAAAPASSGSRCETEQADSESDYVTMRLH